MICPGCSHENRPGARFCEECGQPFELRCPKCGETINPQSKFCSHCGEKLVAIGVKDADARLAAIRSQAPESLLDKMRRSQVGMEGERKPVTILFTDIVGSTSLAEKLDPEEWRIIVGGAHQIVSQAVYRYEGTIAQLLGDGVLAFFGAPITHEDDPLRSVQAALDIQDAIRVYAAALTKSIPDFKLRIGINTGTVVVGNIGDNLHVEYLAIGDTVNLAARLQSQAEPGGILLSQETARYVEQSVELNDLGHLSVKGKLVPVRVFKVTRLKEVRGHGRRLAEGSRKPLVGRQAEMERLLNASAAVQAGLGRVVVLTGEPGLGKTRLIHEWKEQEADQLRWVTGECLSYGQDLPYHLISSWLHNLLELPENASEKQLLEALGQLTGNLFGEKLGESFGFLAHLMSLTLPEEAARLIQGLSPQGYQVQYLATLRQLVLAMTKDQPLALIFEDIHWADPSSVTILSQLISLAKEAPLLFCFSSRPEPGTPGWGLVDACRSVVGGGLVEITLQSLAESEVQQLAVNLLDGESLPDSIQGLVLERAEGNPLFVEELISLLLEKGALVHEDGGLRAGYDLKSISLPENLMRLMLARIDRLAEEPKRTLRVASVIGRQFQLPTLQDVLQRIGQPETRPRLLNQLGELEVASLVQLAAVRPEIQYQFRHAIIQEAAYEAVLKSDRRAMHYAIAEALESAYSDRLDELAPILAYHFERSEVRPKALYYLERAGDRAYRNFANNEAIALYQAAIEQADAPKREDQAGFDPLLGVQLRIKVGDVLAKIGKHEAARAFYEEGLACLPDDQPIWQARLWDLIGNAWIIPRQYDQAIEAYQAAEKALGGRPDESRKEIFSLWLDLQLDHLAAYYWMNDVPRMQMMIDLLAAVIEKQGTALQRSNYYMRLCEMELRRDRYRPNDQTQQHFQLGLAAAQEANDKYLIGAQKFGLGFCHMLRMELDQGEQYLKEALVMSERIGNMEGRVLCSTYLTILYRRKQDKDEVKVWAERSLALAREANLSFYIGIALGNLSWLSYMIGDQVQAEEFIRQAQQTSLHLPTMPMKFVYLWPLLAIDLAKDALNQANEVAGEIIHPSQTRIPDELENLLQKGIEFYAAEKCDQSKDSFNAAVKMAIDLNYF